MLISSRVPKSTHTEVWEVIVNSHTTPFLEEFKAV